MLDDIATNCKDLFIHGYPVLRDEIKYRFFPKKKALSPGDVCIYTSTKHTFTFLYKGMYFERAFNKEVPRYKQVNLAPNTMVMFGGYLEELPSDTLRNKCEVFHGEKTYIVGYPKHYIHTRHMIPDDVLEKMM